MGLAVAACYRSSFIPEPFFDFTFEFFFGDFVFYL